jgi:hypothetical protein
VIFSLYGGSSAISCMFRPSCGHLQAVFVYEEVYVIDLYMHVGIASRLRMNVCLGLLPKIVGTRERERAIVDVSCGQFGTVRLKFKLSTYIQETVGDR